MSRQRRGPALSVVVVLAVVLGMVTVATLATPVRGRAGAGSIHPSRVVPIDAAAAVCPAGGSAAPANTFVHVGTAPTAAGAARSGSATVGPLGGGQALLDLSAAAQTGSVSGRTRPDPLLVRATGSLALGVTGYQRSRAATGRLRGLASTPCVPTGNDFWFVGTGAPIGERARLYVANPGPTPVVVDVDLYGPSGPVRAPSVRGFTVAPGTQVERLLDALAPGAARLGLHVTARQGRIAAAVWDQRVDGLVARGVDWLAPVAAPARRTVVPGIPGGPGPRSLQILDPGSEGAIVRVTVLGPDGGFVPSGADIVDVPAGGVAQVPLERFFGASGGSVQLDSDEPVTAAVVTSFRPRGSLPGEFAVSGAPPAAIRPGQSVVLPAVPIGPTTSARLFLAAPDGQATLDVVPLGQGGAGRAVPVVVKGGAMTQLNPVAMFGLAPSGLALVSRAGSGAVFASFVIREANPGGEMLTVLPLSPTPSTLRVPALQPVLQP